MQPRIYFYANIGDLSKPGYGGGEEGNRRTLNILKSTDFEIIIIPKYQRTTGLFPFRQLKLMLRMMWNYVKFSSILVAGRRRKSIVHIVGFYGIMVYWEYLLVKTASRLGYKVVYEMRGGGAEYFYKSGNILYKKTFNSVIHTSSCIFSQGKENISLITQISKGKDIYYYPNYLTSEFLPKIYPEKNIKEIKCIFFGRLTPTKHIETIIKSIKIIKDRLNIPVKLHLVGNFQTKTYQNEILALIQDLKLASNIEILDACTHDKLALLLLDKNFYIFPSSEPREGHSNALTEAMAYGIVPVASNQGFNKSVIGNDSLIVSEINPEKISQIIISIVNNNKFSILSKEMFTRAHDLFSYEKNSKKFIAKYNSLFSSLQ